MKTKRSCRTNAEPRRRESSSGPLIPEEHFELASRNMTMMHKTLPTRMSRWTVATVALSLAASRAFAAVDNGKTFGAGGVAERFLAVDNAIGHLEGHSERRLQSEQSRIDVAKGSVILSRAPVFVIFPPSKVKKSVLGNLLFCC